MHGLSLRVQQSAAVPHPVTRPRRGASGGELLGGASIQMAFNMGNALGAFCGGLPIAAGLPPRYAALVGVPFLLCGLIACVIFSRKYEPKA